MSKLTSETTRLLHQQYGFRTDAESTQPIGGYQPKEILNCQQNPLLK